MAIPELTAVSCEVLSKPSVGSTNTLCSSVEFAHNRVLTEPHIIIDFSVRVIPTGSLIESRLLRCEAVGLRSRCGRRGSRRR